MWIGIVSLFPDMFNSLNHGIPRKAKEQDLYDLQIFNPRNYTEDKYQTVDDKTYGGGPGMVLMPEPLDKALVDAKTTAPTKPKVIYTSPQGKPLTQAKASELSQCSALVLLCGRYEGIDERIIDTHVDEEISIGDYVLSGGEFAAMVIVDALTRLLPSALGHELSAAQDSFSDGLLDCPHYTRPEYWHGLHVPEVLLSGHHAAIDEWRRKQALGRTWLRRPELLEQHPLTSKDKVLLDEFKNDFRSGRKQ